ncbi:putative vacuolar (H+)-ATPase G subunit [Helianthus anomalus]
MDVSKGQNGIQLLLTAEQEAQQIVKDARNGQRGGGYGVGRILCLNGSRLSEKTYRDSSDNVKGLDKETEAKIQHLKTKADIISYDVVDMLLKNVTSVKS